MKRSIFSIILLAGMLMTLSSCSWFHGDNSGKLGGYWHLTRIDTLETGGYEDMPQTPIFYSVQGEILEVRNVDANLLYIFRYKHVGNTLSLFDARRSWREQGDPVVEDVEELRPFGINKLEESFVIETLDGNHMVLRSGMLKLYFDKF